MRKAHRFKRIWSESQLYHGTVDKSQRIRTKCKHPSVFLSYLYYVSCHHGRVTALAGYVHATKNLSLHCLIFVIYVATWSRAKGESDLLTLGRTHWPSVHAVTLIVCFFFSTFALSKTAGYVLPDQCCLLWCLGLLVHLRLQPLSGQRPQFGEFLCLVSCL